MRCQRVFFSILRCLCLRIFLRRFLITELIVLPLSLQMKTLHALLFTAVLLTEYDVGEGFSGGSLRFLVGIAQRGHFHDCDAHGDAQ